MTEPSPTPPPRTLPSDPLTPPAASATPWVIVLLSITLGMALFIFLALVATQAGVPGA